jgi:hypothetical protein
MTRAVVFLAAAMVAASLGVVAQDVSGGGTNSAPQNNTDKSSQHTVQQPSSPAPSAPSVAATQDSIRPSATGDRNSQKESQADETPATNNGQLPQTSTILPLLGLIGLGSLVAGFFARH